MFAGGLVTLELPGIISSRPTLDEERVLQSGFEIQAGRSRARLTPVCLVFWLFCDVAVAAFASGPQDRKPVLAGAETVTRNPRSAFDHR